MLLLTNDGGGKCCKRNYTGTQYREDLYLWVEAIDRGYFFFHCTL